MKKHNKKIAILQCTIKYPCPTKYANLNVIKTLTKKFPNAVIGFSDHTASLEAPKAAIALGAKIIEKHITLNKKMPGPDHSFALEPDELKQMVKTIRETEQKIKQGKEIKISKVLLGSEQKKTEEVEKYLRDFAYRIIFTTKNIKKGERFTKNKIAILRAAKKTGLNPDYYERLIKGYVAKKDLAEDKPLNLEDIKQGGWVGGH